MIWLLCENLYVENLWNENIDGKHQIQNRESGVPDYSTVLPKSTSKYYALVVQELTYEYFVQCRNGGVHETA